MPASHRGRARTARCAPARPTVRRMAHATRAAACAFVRTGGVARSVNGKDAPASAASSAATPRRGGATWRVGPASVLPAGRARLATSSSARLARRRARPMAVAPQRVGAIASPAGTASTALARHAQPTAQATAGATSTASALATRAGTARAVNSACAPTTAMATAAACRAAAAHALRASLESTALHIGASAAVANATGADCASKAAASA